MRNSILTIMKKEFIRFFTDKRMAITTIFLPGILIYCVYSFMGSAFTNQFSTDDEYKPLISVVNTPDSFKQLATAADINYEDLNDSEVDDIKQEITDSTKDLCVVFPENFDKDVEYYSAASGTAAPDIEIYYNSSEADSQSAYDTVTTILDKYESGMINKFDINNSDNKFDLAKEEDVTAQMFSSMLPMLLLMFMFSGCMAVAPESIAGEKERGTIATLLITPTKRAHIALGKIFALSTIALLSGLSSTVGTILALPKLMGGEENGVVSNVYSAGDYALLAVVIFSTILLLVTVVSIISAFAKTIKEAQTYVTPLLILTMLVGITAMFGNGIKTEIAYYLIPLYNTVQSMVGIFSLNVVPTYMIMTVVANLVYCSIGVFILTKMFNSEKIVFSK